MKAFRTSKSALETKFCVTQKLPFGETDGNKFGIDADIRNFAVDLVCEYHTISRETFVIDYFDLGKKVEEIAGSIGFIKTHTKSGKLVLAEAGDITFCEKVVKAVREVFRKKEYRAVMTERTYYERIGKAFICLSGIEFKIEVEQPTF